MREGRCKDKRVTKITFAWDPLSPSGAHSTMPHSAERAHPDVPLEELEMPAGEGKHAFNHPKPAVGNRTLREGKGKSTGVRVPVAWLVLC